MSNGLNKILNNLKQHNEGADHRAAIEEQRTREEALRSAGPSKEMKINSEILQLIFTQLKTFTDEATFEPMEFVESTMSIDEGRPYFSFSGWRSASLKTGHWISISIENVYESTGYSFRHRNTGKRKIFIGSYGDRKLFKELKQGGFKYYEVAREIFHRMQSAKAKANAEAKRVANRDAVRTVLNGLDDEFTPYNGVTISSTESDDKPVFVVLDYRHSMSIEAATELLNVLKKHGIG